MLAHAIERLLIGLVTLLGITLVTFLVIQLAPGDPIDAVVAGSQRPLTPEDIERLRAHFGLDQPLLVQYGRWLARIATWDFGTSFSTGEDVGAKIARALWPTLSVALLALVVALAIAVPIGIYSAVRRGGAFDRVSGTVLYALYSVPSYVLGMALAAWLGVRWNLLPIRGRTSPDFDALGPLEQLTDLAQHYVLITVCFAAGSLAFYSRFVRQNLLEVVRQDYIRTARAKGLGELRVVVRHAFRNSLIPLITLLGLTLPHLLSGSVILEALFDWPGLGQLYYRSVLARDYPMIMALNLVTSIVVLGATLLADLAYGLADPRVTYD